MTRNDRQVPPGWQVVRLGDVATLQRGVDLPVQDRADGPIPVYGSNGILDTHSQTPHSGPGVITGRSGSIGEVFFSAGPYWPLNTTLYVSNFHGNSELFIYYLLSHLRLERFAASTGVPSLNRNFVHPEPVAVPPLHEQRAIAAVLDSIDEASERTEAVIAATERLRDALLHELLTRGVPGWHTEWKEVPGIGTIPADWEVVRLGDVLESTTYGTNASLNEVGTTPVLRMNNLQNGTLDLSDIRRADLSKKESDYLNLVPGDILFNRTNSLILVGKVGIVRELPQPISFASYLVRLRVREILANPLWLSAMLWAPNYQARIRRFATPGVSQANINPTSLKSLMIPLPSLPEQEIIARVLDGVDTAIKQIKVKTNVLISLKASAADALLSGRVRGRTEGEKTIGRGVQ